MDVLACVPPKAGKNKVTPMNVDRSCQISIGWEKDLRRVPTDLDKTSSTASTVVVTTPPLPTELHEEEEEDSRKTSAGLFPNVLEPSPRTHSFSQRDRKLSLGGSRRSRCTSIVGTTSSHPPNLEDNDNNNKNEFVSEDYIEAGKFFAKEELDAELDSSTGGTPPPESPRFIPDNNIPTAADKKAEEAGIYCKERRAASYLTFDRTTTISNNSLTVVESSSLPFPSTTLPTKHDEAHGDVGPSCWREFIRQLCPLPFDEFDDGAWWERVYLIAKVFWLSFPNFFLNNTVESMYCEIYVLL